MLVFRPTLRDRGHPSIHGEAKRLPFPAPPADEVGALPTSEFQGLDPTDRERPSGLANLGPAGQPEEGDDAEAMIGPGDHPRGPVGLDKQCRPPVDPDAPHLGTPALGPEPGKEARAMRPYRLS